MAKNEWTGDCCLALAAVGRKCRKHEPGALQGCADHRVRQIRTCKACKAAYARLHRIRHSDLTDDQRRKANCRSYTNVLVRRGKITRQPCSKCGTIPAQGHHPDYDNPRLLVWLCEGCHEEHHRNEARG